MFRAVCFVSLITVAVCTSAEGASITFQNETFASGSGIGNVPTILVVQETDAETAR